MRVELPPQQLSLRPCGANVCSIAVLPRRCARYSSVEDHTYFTVVPRMLYKDCLPNEE